MIAHCHPTNIRWYCELAVQNPKANPLVAAKDGQEFVDDAILLKMGPGQIHSRVLYRVRDNIEALYTAAVTVSDMVHMSGTHLQVFDIKLDSRSV